MRRPLSCATGIVVLAVIALPGTSSSETSKGWGRSGEPSACPATASHPGFGQYRALKTAVVPGEPRRLRLCEYSTMHGPLQGERLLDRRKRLAQLFNRLSERPSEPLNCPASDGVRFIARFAYMRRREAVVAVDTAGCRGVSNGSITRMASRRLISRLFELRR